MQVKDLRLCFFSKACLFVALHPYQSYIQSSSKHWKPQQSTDQPNLLDLWGRLGFCLFWSACLPLRLFGATAPSGKFQWNIARRINETFHKYHKTPQSKKNMNFWLPWFIFWYEKKMWLMKKHYQLPSWFIICPTWIGRKSTPGARPDFFQAAAGALGDPSGLTGSQGMSGANFQCQTHNLFFPLAKMGNFKLVVFCFLAGECKKKAPLFFSSTSTSLHCENSSHLVQDPRKAIFCSWPAATIDVIDVRRAVAE